MNMMLMLLKRMLLGKERESPGMPPPSFGRPRNAMMAGLLPPGPDVNYSPGVYDPQLDFGARVKEAFELGIDPPRSPDPADLREYRSRAWPLLEQRRIRDWTDNPELEQHLRYRRLIGI